MKAVAALVLALAATSTHAVSFLAQLDLDLAFEDLDPGDAYQPVPGWGHSAARADITYNTGSGEQRLGHHSVDIISAGQVVASQVDAHGVKLQSSVVANGLSTAMELRGEVTAVSTTYALTGRHHSQASAPTFRVAIAPGTRMTFSGAATSDFFQSVGGFASSSVLAYGYVHSVADPTVVLWSESFSEGLVVEDGMSEGSGSWAFGFSYANGTGEWQYADLYGSIGISGMTSPIPEPASALLVGLGASCLVAARRWSSSGHNGLPRLG